MEYLGYSGLFELLMNAQLNDGTWEDIYIYAE